MALTTFPSVVVVDRDATACRLMREVCQSGGWRVQGCAQDANGAMALLARTRPTCLVTGYKFEGTVTGLHLIHHARQLLPGLFTILYTAWDINDVAANITTDAPDRILRKPMPPHLLLELLDSVQSRVIRQAREREQRQSVPLAQAGESARR